MAFGSLMPLLSNRASMWSALPTASAAVGHRPAEDGRNLNLEPVRAVTEANMCDVSIGGLPARFSTALPLRCAAPDHDEN